MQALAVWYSWSFSTSWIQYLCVCASLTQLECSNSYRLNFRAHPIFRLWPIRTYKIESISPNITNVPKTINKVAGQSKQAFFALFSKSQYRKLRNRERDWKVHLRKISKNGSPLEFCFFPLLFVASTCAHVATLTARKKIFSHSPVARCKTEQTHFEQLLTNPALKNGTEVTGVWP